MVEPDPILFPLNRAASDATHWLPCQAPYPTHRGLIESHLLLRRTTLQQPSQQFSLQATNVTVVGGWAVKLHPCGLLLLLLLLLYL